MDTDEEEYVQEELYNQTLLDQYLENGDIDQFRDEFLALHTYRQGEYFEDTTDEGRQEIFQYLSPEEVANSFDQLDIDDDEYESLFDRINATHVSYILEEMSYDNAVDTLNELTEQKVASLLALMNKGDANEIKTLLHYDENTTGGIMTTEYLSLKAHTPVRETLLLVKAQTPDTETIRVILVVDDDGELVGTLPLRDLIVAKNDVYTEDIMSERVISANIADDQEDVAQVARDYNFMAVPVIDYQEHLLGIIMINDILDAMDEEASEDYSRLAGMSNIDSTNDSIIKTASEHLPWLIILAFLGMIAATILGGFEKTLENVALLVAFILIISDTSENSGTQSLAVSVYSTATGGINEQSKFRIALREVGSGALSSVVCSIILFTIIVVIYHQPLLVLIVAGSLTYTVTAGTFVGSVIPPLMNKLDIDPAVASGPFIIAVNDIISMLIYFGLVTSFMAHLI